MDIFAFCPEEKCPYVLPFEKIADICIYSRTLYIIIHYRALQGTAGHVLMLCNSYFLFLLSWTKMQSAYSDTQKTFMVNFKLMCNFAMFFKSETTLPCSSNLIQLCHVLQIWYCTQPTTSFFFYKDENKNLLNQQIACDWKCLLLP